VGEPGELQLLVEAQRRQAVVHPAEVGVQAAASMLDRIRTPFAKPVAGSLLDAHATAA
jgi:hypothetical protein